MKRYIWQYPISLLLVAVVIYFSFCTPPKTKLDDVRFIDKLVHVGMYFVLSISLWWEFWRAHRAREFYAPRRHAWVGACLVPILFGGVVELLQAYCTENRSGDWLDFLANAVGVVLASLIGHVFVTRYYLTHNL